MNGLPVFGCFLARTNDVADLQASQFSGLISFLITVVTVL
jgi:hypothetical protein